MTNHRKGSRFGSLAVAFGVLIISACSGDGGPTTVASPPATAQPETVIAEAYAETEATIIAINRKARTVTLRLADGQSQTVQVPADTDLSKRKTGEIVLLGAYEKVSVRALPPGSAPLGMTRDTAEIKAKPGETPGRAAAERTVVVTEVAAIDVANNTVTLRGADGGLRTLDVRNPENQRKLQTLKVGDLVQFEVIEAGGVQLKPRP